MAGWAVAVLVLGGCETAGDPGGDVDPTQAAAKLEEQRTEVRALVATLAAGAATTLGGPVRSAIGHWEGCDSVFPEGHRNFRYRASARIDAAASARRPYLDALAPALDEAGVSATPGERPGGRTLGGPRGELEARFSELGDGGYVLLDVSGPCIEVPEEQREEWEGRRDPAPILD